MAGLTIGDIRRALAAQLRANLDAETNVDASGVGMPLPCIRIVLDAPPTYTASYGGLATVPFVLVIEPAGVDESSVARLDDYMSSGLGNNSSVIDALRADRTLGGTAMDVQVTGRSYDAVNVTAEYDVVVYVRKQT